MVAITESRTIRTSIAGPWTIRAVSVTWAIKTIVGEVSLIRTTHVLSIKSGTTNTALFHSTSVRRAGPCWSS